MQFHQLLTESQLQDRFGPVVGHEGGLSVTATDLVGPLYRSLLGEMVEIVSHQWRSAIRRGAIKGFFLSGPPGIGKTSLTLRVAYELALRFRTEMESAPDGTAGLGSAHPAHSHAASGASHSPNGPAASPVISAVPMPTAASGLSEGAVTVALIDGGDIARSRYGESEERLREVFSRAQKGFTDPSHRSIILFDDVESILMARGSSNAKEWHFSQDSVFFHAVDELDTSRTAVFLTSNRPDLVDDAIRDRFLAYSLGRPDPDLLVEVALRRAAEHHFDDEQQARLAARVRREALAGEVRSVREAERLVVRQYIEDVLGRRSMAELGEG